jgi:hypothetical protein
LSAAMAFSVLSSKVACQTSLAFSDFPAYSQILLRQR